MNHPARRPLQAAALSLWLMAAAAVASPSATPPTAAKAATEQPAGTAAQRAQTLFRAEMAHCASGQSVQGRQVCEREARAAHAQNLRGHLGDGGSRQTYRQNAEQRCKPLPAAERGVCMKRVHGQAAPDEVLVVPGSEAPLQATTPPRQ